MLISPNNDNPPVLMSEILEQSRLDGWRGEVLDRRKDGTEFPIFLSTSKIVNPDGRVIGLMGVAQDITERKWAERWLQTQRDFGTYLSSSIGLNATAMQLLEIALQNEGIDCGGVYLVDPETGALDLVAHRGFSADFAKHASHFAADPGPARPAGRGRAISRPPGGPLTGIVQQLKRESLLAMEVLPVQHSGEVVAVLSVGSHVRGEIPAKSCQALEVIADSSRRRHSPDPGGTIVASQPPTAGEDAPQPSLGGLCCKCRYDGHRGMQSSDDPNIWLHPRRIDWADNRLLACE